jgi:hypothetical protein
MLRWQGSASGGVQRVDFGGPIIACVGDHDWGLLAAPLKSVLKARSDYLPSRHR